MTDSGGLLRTKDVAYILDCSPDDVIELARSKKLKGTKVGRFWRFRQRAVMAYKRKQEEYERDQRLSSFG